MLRRMHESVPNHFRKSLKIKSLTYPATHVALPDLPVREKKRHARSAPPLREETTQVWR